ncbi:MAG TPA: pilin [Candidatus Paceibacterota bacterium]|jgi:hypothetical protein|nr:pilin [Candidatus Paceibacterota bacterium]
MTALVTTVHNILNAVIPVMISLGVVYFVWGVVQYVIADAEEAKKTGKDRIIYGIIGLAVIVSLWGLVNILVTTFGLGGTAPTVAQSGVCTIGNTFATLANYVTCIIGSAAIPLLFALAVLVFVWGVVKFFFINYAEEAKRTEGRQFMVWGIIALTVMLCVWGLVGILGSTFGITTSVLPHTNTGEQ